ncbi:2-phospho-L-lactate guanylyltransferase [Aquihabitans daechungensis]|uniref:2-phospho-L-lactate guanylyltransferase n=1 Tax=Aquihabitans daechungensis TaxID=1052257 RepID=UPI003B9F26D3
MQAAVVVPVKAFHAAKLRLAPALSPGARAVLAREMATRVVRAAGALPVLVVCDDEDVRSWAAEVGATPHWTPGLGLIGAVEAGVDAAAADGADRVLVAHADLPLATGLDHVVGEDGVVIVPDRWHDGTNVIAVPAASGFRFAYGPGSAERHQAEARRLGLRVEVVDDQVLGWDVDLPGDLQLPSGEDLAAGARS